MSDWWQNSQSLQAQLSFIKYLWQHTIPFSTLLFSIYPIVESKQDVMCLCVRVCVCEDCLQHKDPLYHTTVLHGIEHPQLQHLLQTCCTSTTLQSYTNFHQLTQWLEAKPHHAVYPERWPHQNKGWGNHENYIWMRAMAWTKKHSQHEHCVWMRAMAWTKRQSQQHVTEMCTK